MRIFRRASAQDSPRDLPGTRASERSSADFEALYELTGRSVLAYAMRRTAGPADAEDAVAETFVVAWRRQVETPAEPLPWLYGICRRVLANQRRSTERRALLRLRVAGTTRAQSSDLRMEGGPAGEALARLRPDDQELLRLLAWEGLDHAAIARVLGISVNAVAIRLHRARARFAEAFAGVTSAQLKDSSQSRTSVLVTGRNAGREREDAR